MSTRRLLIESRARKMPLRPFPRSRPAVASAHLLRFRIHSHCEVVMPKISVEGIDARNEAKKVSKGYEERAELRAAIANLSADQTLRLSPSNGESTRKLKMMTGRAAKEVNLAIKYEESV